MINQGTDKYILEERKKLLEYIKKHPDEELIHVEQDLLEKLIFSYNYALAYDKIYGEHSEMTLPGIETKEEYETLYPNKEAIMKKAILVKIPVWTGPFLRKIDLSEVDFSNCLWDPEVLDQYDIIWGSMIDENFKYELTTNKVPMEIDSETFNRNYVDLSYTNAKIDFSKSFNARVFDDHNTLVNCNFEGVDLSNSNTEYITSMFNCKLAKTIFKIFNMNEIYIRNCDLRTLDLSDIETYFAAGVMYSEKVHVCIEYSNVKDTGLTVHVVPGDDEMYGCQLKIFCNLVNKGFYNGCHIKMHYYTSIKEMIL